MANKTTTPPTFKGESPWTQGEVDTIGADNKTLESLVNQQQTAASQAAEPVGAAKVGGSSSEKLLATAGKPAPTTQQDVNSYLDPYVKEMMNLGPEYQSEMDFLKPYLEGTGPSAPETFKQLQAGSQADESPTGSKAVNAADQAAGTQVANEPAPGFGALAKAGKEYEGTLPYSDILQTVLGAGKNEILYGTTPNISSISTKEWPEQLQQAYSYLTQAATGTNAGTGLNNPTVAAKTASPTGTGSTSGADGVFSDTSGVQAGGSGS